MSFKTPDPHRFQDQDEVPANGGLTPEFWRIARPEREPISSRWFLPAVLLILAAATPWYLPEEVASRLVSGLPVWVWITLVGAVALSVLTAVGALLLWRDPEVPNGPDSLEESAPSEAARRNDHSQVSGEPGVGGP